MKKLSILALPFLLIQLSGCVQDANSTMSGGELRSTEVMKSAKHVGADVVRSVDCEARTIIYQGNAGMAVIQGESDGVKMCNNIVTGKQER